MMLERRYDGVVPFHFFLSSSFLIRFERYYRKATREITCAQRSGESGLLERAAYPYAFRHKYQVNMRHQPSFRIELGRIHHHKDRLRVESALNSCSVRADAEGLADTQRQLWRNLSARLILPTLGKLSFAIAIWRCALYID